MTGMYECHVGYHVAVVTFESQLLSYCCCCQNLNIRVLLTMVSQAKTAFWGGGV